jgi:hypothetical protein
MSFNICRGTLGSLAMFTAIRNASPRDSRPKLSAFVSVIGVLAAARISDRRGMMTEAVWTQRRHLRLRIFAVQIDH